LLLGSLKWTWEVNIKLDLKKLLVDEWIERALMVSVVLSDRGLESRQGVGIYLFTTASRPALGPTQPPIHWVPEVLSLRLKRPGREADHLLPSSAEVRNTWSCTSTPKYAFKTWCSVKNKGTT
jgi:hypothetical protein